MQRRTSSNKGKGTSSKKGVSTVKKTKQTLKIKKQPSVKRVTTEKDKLKEKTKEKRLAEKKREEERKLKVQKERTEQYKDSSDKSRFYCTNKGLMEELIKWRDSNPNPAERQPSEEIGKMFMEIANKLTNHSYFRNYPQSVKDECVSYALEKMVSGIKNYNFKFTNPFAYFTQSCFNSFKTVLSKHYKQVNIKRALKKQMLINIEANMPGSSIGKTLENGFENDDYEDYE